MPEASHLQGSQHDSDLTFQHLTTAGAVCTVATTEKTSSPSSQLANSASTATDIEMGNALGIDTIAVSWGAHPIDRLRAVAPTHVIDTAAQLHQFAPQSGRDQI